MNFVQEIRHVLPETFGDVLKEADVKEAIVGSRIHRLIHESFEKVSILLDSSKIGNHLEVDSLSLSIEVLLDISWEMINTGYWKDVSVDWRLCFGHASLLSVIIESSTLELSNDEEVKPVLKKMLRTLDLALFMSPESKIMSRLATIIHSHLSEFSFNSEPTRICNKKMRHNNIVIDPNHQIKSIQSPDLFEFQEKFLRADIPTVIRDAISYWPCLDATSGRMWSVEYLKSIAGYRTVPVEIGSKYTDATWSQRLMTINEFVDQFIDKRNETQPIAYLAQHELFNQIPKLRSDFTIPDLCSCSRGDHEQQSSIDINAWFGPSETVSPLHTDPNDNLLVQVFGSKYIRLYHKDIPSDVIYCHDSKLLNNTSQVDIENVDEDKFPNFHNHSTKYMSETLLNPGEMLFIPRGFWHFVKSTSTSFSISFWWS